MLKTKQETRIPDSNPGSDLGVAEKSELLSFPDGRACYRNAKGPSPLASIAPPALHSPSVCKADVPFLDTMPVSVYFRNEIWVTSRIVSIRIMVYLMPESKESREIIARGSVRIAWPDYMTKSFPEVKSDLEERLRSFLSKESLVAK